MNNKDKYEDERLERVKAAMKEKEKDEQEKERKRESEIKAMKEVQKRKEDSIDNLVNRKSTYAGYTLVSDEKMRSDGGINANLIADYFMKGGKRRQTKRRRQQQTNIRKNKKTVNRRRPSIKKKWIKIVLFNLQYQTNKRTQHV